jgi:hypothetical protein
VASHFHSTLEPVSFQLSPDLTEVQRRELAVEAEFYGLLDRMMPPAVPYYEQDQIGVRLLKRACFTGTQHALQSAVATARALVIGMESATPWLTAEFQDPRYLITDHVVNDAPVWAAENGKWFMYRSGTGTTQIGGEAHCAAGNSRGVLFNTMRNPDVLEPTKLPTNAWRSSKSSTLGPQYTSAGGADEKPWVGIPDMRVTAVHGLDDAAPAMAAALRKLAALTGDE